MSKMRVCIVTYGAYPDPAGVVSGNSVRSYFLAKGLLAHGLQIDWLYPQFLNEVDAASGFTSEEGIEVATFAGSSDLLQLLDSRKPAVVLVGYWELLEHFPEEYPIPIVVDVVAPRILEALYETGSDPGADAEKLIRLYRRADTFLAGNERQRHFLLPWLLLAGFDCRAQAPVITLPISVEPPAARPQRKINVPVLFVTGGVSWPWRNATPWLERVVDALEGLSGDRARLHLLSGSYLYSGKDSSTGGKQPWDSRLVVSEPLKPYGEMAAFFAGPCDVGIELADKNTEREYSQSFRAMEFLRAGLPLICNNYLEIASHVQEFDAGWVVSDPEQVAGIVQSIVDNPQRLSQKSANAKRLVEEHFDCVKNTQALAEYIKKPVRPILAPHSLLVSQRSSERPGHIATPGIKGRVTTWLGDKLRQRFPSRSDAVISVSRSDIFPTDHGAAVKIDRTAWGLSHRVEAVYLVTDSRKVYHRYTKGQREELSYPHWLRFSLPPRGWGRRRLEARGIPRDNAFLFDLVYDWSFLLRYLYVAFRYGARRYLAEFPVYARACFWAKRLFGGTVVIAEHNVEYQRLLEQYPSMPQRGYRLARALELNFCKRADAVVVVSEPDRRTLVHDGVDYRRIHLISHGVDLDAFDQAPSLDVRARFSIPDGVPLLVYHGTYMYPPNLEAMQALAEEVLPLLREQGMAVKVLAIGAHPPDHALHEDIIFTGSVESVAPYLRAADAAVVPLLQGGGTRMKVLDYFAAKIPVISTSKGVEGLPLKDAREVLIRDDFGDFANAVQKVLSDTSFGSELAESGRRMVDSLDWRNIADSYLQLFPRINE